MTKDELRAFMKIKRRYLGDVQRQAFDEMICADFMTAYGNYDSFLLYSSVRGEAGTDLIIRALLAADKQVFLPRVEGGDIAAVPYGTLKAGVFGIPEPSGERYCGDIDVTVVPLLAVNPRGYRIGYGRGFYDRYLRDRKTRRVGLGYFMQLSDFTEEVWDEPLDEFLCERGIYFYGRQTKE